METDSCVNRAEFNAFCDEQYPPGILSKTMRSDRRDRISGWLKGIYSPPQRSWRNRIIERGFSLVSFPGLDILDVLCLKGTEQDGLIEQGIYGEWRKVVSVEEFYDLLLDTHVRVLSHGGYRCLMKAVEVNYTGIPRAAVLKFVAMCSECRKNPRQQPRAVINTSEQKVIKLEGITRDFNRRCQIDILDMTQCPDGQYTYIGLYTDHWTKFVTLFPMMGCTPEHVAYGLASSVFPYYGPPHFLHSTEGKEFAAEVVRLSIDKWKGGERTVVPQAKEALMYMDQAVERTRDSLIRLINQRTSQDMTGVPLPWATWLGKIMFDINNQQNERIGKSSFKRLFERTVASTSEEPDKTSQRGNSSSQSSAPIGSKSKRKSSSDDDAGVIITSYKSPQPPGALKRPHTFVAIDNQR